MFSIVLGAASGLTALSSAVFAAECLVGARARASLSEASEESSQPGANRAPLLVAIVPAHNEEAGLADTLASIREDLSPGDRLLVVADNCSDATAEVAARCGAEVLVRENLSERGKGHAIHFAVDSLRESPPEVVVVLDADCRIASRTIAALARQCVRTGCPIQADYLLVAPEGSEPTTKSRISEFAVRVRNRVRLRGGQALGIPSALTGSGMAFPWQVIAGAPSMKGNIVEDLALGIELALLGTAPQYCPEARVTSALPSGDDAAQTQRNRWETGHLATLFRQVPRLLIAGVVQRRLALIKMGLDLSIPPLSLLVALQGLFVLAGVGYVLVGGSPLPLILGGAGLAAVFIGVRAAWKGEGQDVLPRRALLGIPAYALGKVPRYLKFFTRGPERAWVRTKRDVPS